MIRIRFVLALSVASFVSMVAYGQVCSDENEDRLTDRGLEAELVQSICEADVATFNGTIVIVENQLVFVPSGFVVDSDNRRYRTKMLPKENLLTNPEWTFTSLVISDPSESPSNVVTGSVDATSFHAGVDDSSCDFDLEITGYKLYMEDGAFFQAATEIAFSQSIIVLYGGGHDLGRAMAESFVRANCRSQGDH